MLHLQVTCTTWIISDNISNDAIGSLKKVWINKGQNMLTTYQHVLNLSDYHSYLGHVQRVVDSRRHATDFCKTPLHDLHLMPTRRLVRRRSWLVLRGESVDVPSCAHVLGEIQNLYVQLIARRQSSRYLCMSCLFNCLYMTQPVLQTAAI